MWRNISTRLFRQYFQAGIQTSGAGCQDDECKRSTISSGFILANYTLKESNAVSHVHHSIRLHSTASPSQTEDEDRWEKNEEKQHFRCGNFWSSCRNYGNLAEAMGLGSAIVLGLQLNRSLNNVDRDDLDYRGRLYRLAHAMPLPHNTRKCIMPPTASTSKPVQENQQKKQLQNKEEDIFDESAESFKKIALEGLGVTYNDLGLELANTGQYNLAFPHFKEGAKAGNRKAQFNLAVCYEQGRGVDTNDIKAAKWYKQAASQGHPMAQYNYGIFKLLGNGRAKKDEKEALHWLDEAATQGICQAQSYLGSLWTLGPNKNLDKGIHFLQEAVKQKDVEATYRLGLCYEEGLGVVTNHAKAADLYNKAATKGHGGAQCCMGRFHQLGLGGLPANTSEAKLWFQTAIESGNKEAKHCLNCLEAEEILLEVVEKEPSVSLTHCSHSAPNLSGVLGMDDISAIDSSGSGDAKSPMWCDWPSISYLDLLPSLRNNANSFSKQSRRCSFQIGSEDNLDTFSSTNSDMKVRFSVAR